MTDILELYRRVFPEKDAGLDLEQGSFAIEPLPPATHERVVETLQDFTGPGWIEWVDAVRYRNGDGWICPAENAPDEADPDNGRILAGEIADAASKASLRIRYLADDQWSMQIIRDGGDTECLAFETKTQSVARDLPTLRHVTYWDADAGTAQVSRFTGFGDPSDTEDGNAD